MKNRISIWFIIVLIVAAAWFLFHRSRLQSSDQQEPMTNAVTTVTNPLANPAQPVSVVNSVASQPPIAVPNTNDADIEQKYSQGLIGKDEAVIETKMAENKKSLDVYGKVVDQNGQPVTGASVRGDVTLNTGYMSNKDEVHVTETDADGRFSFLGLNGTGLGIWPQKDGYIYDLKLPSKRPDSYQPDPNNPIILTMWKSSGTSNLVSFSFGYTIPFDGTPTSIDIATEKKATNGDLQITLLRSPLEVPRGGQKFDWTAKIEMIHGGLVAENDSYPYWAPENGYQPSSEFDMSSNSVPWRSTMAQDFYIRSSHGQYGRMKITIYANLSPARVRFDFWINSAGSQNLEPVIQNN